MLLRPERPQAPRVIPEVSWFWFPAGPVSCGREAWQGLDTPIPGVGEGLTWCPSTSGPVSVPVSISVGTGPGVVSSCRRDHPWNVRKRGGGGDLTSSTLFFLDHNCPIKYLISQSPRPNKMFCELSAVSFPTELRCIDIVTISAVSAVIWKMLDSEQICMQTLKM